MSQPLDDLVDMLMARIEDYIDAKIRSAASDQYYGPPSTAKQEEKLKRALLETLEAIKP